MSHEAASLLVEMQLALNEGRPFAHLPRERRAGSTTLRAFLARALPAEPGAVASGGRS
jgi:hypothetical protein